MSRDAPGLAIALGLILLGGAILWQARGLSAMGGVFPITIALVMMVAAALFVVLRLLRPKPVAERAAGSPLRRLGIVAVLAVWALLFPVVGFAVTSAVAFVVVFVLANHDPWTPRRLAVGAAVAVLASAAAWWLMSRVLYIPMPRGLLF